MLTLAKLWVAFSHAPVRPRRSPARIAALLRDCGGLALTEFALILPIFVGFGLVGMEYTNVVLARQKTERVAATLADQIAGNQVPPNERQIGDLFSAVDLIARPFPITEDGTVILTAVVGIYDYDTNQIENKIAWQRCHSPDGVNSVVGTQWSGTDISEGLTVTIPGGIDLAQNQMVIVSEVTYNYKPLISTGILEEGGATNRLFRETAVYRTRGAALTSITPVSGVAQHTC